VLPFKRHPRNGHSTTKIVALICLPAITRRFRRGPNRRLPPTRPNAALDHGTAVSHDAEDRPDVAAVERRLLAPCYIESGWPVVLAPVAAEARRRFDAGELRDEEFYCSDVALAGIRNWSRAATEYVRPDRATSARKASAKH
jgi:hypothetical protein